MEGGDYAPEPQQRLLDARLKAGKTLGWQQLIESDEEIESMKRMRTGASKMTLRKRIGKRGTLLGDAQGLFQGESVSPSSRLAREVLVWRQQRPPLMPPMGGPILASAAARDRERIARLRRTWWEQK